jgi:Protein of unknown function (DUF664)
VTEPTPLQALLVDSFTRVRELVVDLTDGLTEETAIYRADPEANSISWLIWHLTRTQDDHVAELAGTAQRWPEWRDEFDLPFPDWATGYNQTAQQVGAVRTGGELLGRYHADVHQLTLDYLDRFTDDEAARVVDTNWDPPVTAAVRLVSVLGDVLQHLGQAGYVRGLAERRSRAWQDPGAADR